MRSDTNNITFKEFIFSIIFIILFIINCKMLLSGVSEFTRGASVQTLDDLVKGRGQFTVVFYIIIISLSLLLNYKFFKTKEVLKYGIGSILFFIFSFILYFIWVFSAHTGYM